MPAFATAGHRCTRHCCCRYACALHLQPLDVHTNMAAALRSTGRAMLQRLCRSFASAARNTHRAHTIRRYRYTVTP